MGLCTALGQIYFLVYGVSFIVTSSIYFVHLRSVTDFLPDVNEECVPNLFPPSTSHNETTPTCGNVQAWKCYAILGILMGGLCLLKFIFMLVTCVFGSGKKSMQKTKKYARASLRATPVVRGLVQNSRQYSQDSEAEAPPRTCAVWFLSCTICWIGMMLIVALIVVPIYLALQLHVTHALEVTDVGLSTHAQILFILCVAKLVILLLSFCVSVPWTAYQTGEKKRRRSRWETANEMEFELNVTEH